MRFTDPGSVFAMSKRTAPVVDGQAAKDAIFEYALRKGALAVGVADLEAIERIAPPGHRPSDIMPRVKSVISLPPLRRGAKRLRLRLANRHRPN